LEGAVAIAEKDTDGVAVVRYEIDYGEVEFFRLG